MTCGKAPVLRRNLTDALPGGGRGHRTPIEYTFDHWSAADQQGLDRRRPRRASVTMGGITNIVLQQNLGEHYGDRRGEIR